MRRARLPALSPAFSPWENEGIQRAAPLFPKILYGWWAQMLPPGGRQDGGSNLREEQEAEAQQPRLSLGIPRGSPSFNTNILSTTVRENHIEIPASVHRASLGTEGTAAHGKKSQGPRGGLGQTKEGPGLRGQRRWRRGRGGKGPDEVCGRGRRRPSRGGGRAWARRGGTVRLGAAGGQDDPRSGSLGGKWGFDGACGLGAGGVCPFQGSVRSTWALLSES